MSAQILSIIFLVPVTILLIIAAILIYRSLKYKSKINKEIDAIAKTIRIERLRKIDSILTRVSIVVKGNDEYDKTFLELRDKYDEIELLIKRSANLFENINTNASKMKKHLLYKKINEIKNLIKKIDSLENDFITSSSIITQQDHFLSREYVFFSSNLRAGIRVYQLKRIVLSKLSTKIDELLDNIKDEGKQFNNYLELAQNNEASMHLKIYSEKITEFIKVISEAPKIETYIYTTIPRVIESLTKIYKEKKNELSASMNHINLKESLYEISKHFNDAKVYYSELKFKETKDTIKQILRAVKILERMINFEIASRNYFIHNYENVIMESKVNLKKFASLKKQVNKLVEKGETLSNSLRISVEENDALAIEINKRTLNLREVMKDKNTPYSSKISRMKLLLKKLNLFVLKMNEMLTHLWSINIEASLIKNKFKKSEAALNEVLANMKPHNVKLVNDQKNEYEYLSNMVNSIAERIKERRYDKELKNETEELMKLTSKFYMAVSGNIQIAEIASNLIKELAPLRAGDTRLNIVLNSSERAYLEGKYAHALNTIITELERRGE
ncbi:MAG: hypothetical protein HRT99_00655 [Mycoplasmatales bacterium]|nr:hypothetical protein [Mycoplasmatales bacterium]